MTEGRFEVSWEVGNKVGGIYTVVSSKAPTLVRRYGDRYVAIGPWLLSGDDREPPFQPTPGHEEFEAGCRELGIPVRVGRWEIPGRPRTILVAFSRLFERKDAILAGLWEQFRVDSLLGGWDYVEPVLFGHAAGIVIERWWRAHLAPQGTTAVALFHEWMTGSGVLYLKQHAPAIGTIFTTHATVLGRSIASGGRHPTDPLGTETPEALATRLGIRAKHSMEGVVAREADVFTAVSHLTSEEAERFHGRRGEPVVPNGIDLGAIDELLAGTTRERSRAALERFAGCFLGEPVGDAAFVTISGRYEFHNKGIDLTLDALADLDQQPGRRIVLFVLVPAGNSGIRSELLARLRAGGAPDGGAIGITTHNLFDPEQDPVVRRCREIGLDNAPERRTKVVQVPVYLGPGDGVFDLPYEAVLQGMDLGCFPSFYEPWGYTPEEGLAVGVPIVTTDCAGFGQWALANGLGAEDGILIVPRLGRPYAQAREELARVLREFVAAPPDRERQAAACREAAGRLSWERLIDNYELAATSAAAAARTRAPQPPQEFALPARRITVRGMHRRPQLYPFQVQMKLPPELAPLEQLARNLWWTWNAPAQQLFADFSPQGWARARHNPVRLLQDVFAGDVQARRIDREFRARVDRVAATFRAYVDAAPSSFDAGGTGIDRERPVAYLCAEYGLHESLPIYGGGLGVLAADQLKSASDLGLPLVAVGLYYRHGYLRQRLSSRFEQIAEEVDQDPAQLPLELVRDERGDPVQIVLQMPTGRIAVQAWRVAVGRVTLYLLDSDLPGNLDEDRRLTHRLYGGDQETRLRQEIVLGRAGVRLLQRLGITPSVWHLNEGHAALAALERLGQLVRKDGLTFDAARLLVRTTTVFTTHTPIPAGHDRFAAELIRRYFNDIEHWAGLTWDRFWALGLGEDEDASSFNMTYLACKLSAAVNGVSRLHGEVTRKLLQPIWPALLTSEAPVTTVTNGVHLPSWTDPRLAALLGAADRPVTGADFATRARKLDDAALWSARTERRRALLAVARERLERGFLSRHESTARLARILDAIETDALWIGFARRFVPYKRADLLLRDLGRLRRLLGDEDRPVRLLLAGKAHPMDRAGQEILRRVAEASRDPELVGRLVLLEDYDLELARALVRGVDVWLNTPLRPLEASGTSGMKVAANGGLNLSIADGWWAEADDGQNGWTIGNGMQLPTRELQDESDAHHLFELLEQEIVPLFFDRDAAGLPRGWLARVKHALATIPPRFDSDRMVREYAETYARLAAHGARLAAGDCAELKRVAADHARIRRGFPEVRILAANLTDPRALAVGGELAAQVDVELGPLGPDDVQVELVYGHAGEDGELPAPTVVALAPDAAGGSPRAFRASVPFDRSGRFACGLRLRAHGRGGFDEELSDLVLWSAVGGG